MVSRDTVGRMVDGAEDLSDIWLNPFEQATEPTPPNT